MYTDYFFTLIFFHISISSPINSSYALKSERQQNNQKALVSDLTKSESVSFVIFCACQRHLIWVVLLDCKHFRLA